MFEIYVDPYQGYYPYCNYVQPPLSRMNQAMLDAKIDEATNPVRKVVAEPDFELYTPKGTKVDVSFEHKKVDLYV